MAVRDECGGEAVLVQLYPDGIAMTGDLQRDSIAQMGGQSSASFHGEPNLLRRSVSMADRHMDTAFAERRDIGVRFMPVGRKGGVVRRDSGKSGEVREGACGRGSFHGLASSRSCSAMWILASLRMLARSTNH